MQPFLHHFLYAESLSDGVDATRFSDLNNATPPVPTKNNDPNPGRNGEPAGELGLVLQQDDAWHAQTGAPTDPQAGNTPGTQRDVLRSASFAPNTVTGMFADTGNWTLSNSAYQNNVNKVSGDNISLFDLDTWLPGNFFEIQSTMKVMNGGTQQNGFIIFDYQGPTNFKYAGIDVTHNLLKIGQRTDAGWTDLATLSAGKPNLGVNSQNTMLLTVNGTTATLSVASSNAQNSNVLKLSFTFASPLNTGLVGVGTNNSIASYTSYTVQKLPVAFTYSVLEDFSDGVANNFTTQTGTWTATSGTSGRYFAVPPANDAAISTRPLAVAPLSYVEYSATVNASKAGTSAGLTFAYTSTNDFLYAGIIAGTNQVVLGHRSNGNWYVDAVASTTITAGTDYSLLVALTEGTTNGVNVVLNGKSVLSFNYNILVHDGSLGLFARNGNASFDNVLIRGDDIAYAGGGAPQVAATAASQPVAGSSLTAGDLAPIVAAAKELWTDALAPGDPRLAILDQVSILVSDLPDQMLGATTGTTIVLDSTAAGWGWFVDPTPLGNSEFPIVLANGAFAADPGSPAYHRIDLLTTVLHELGNAMGFAEDQGQDVTGATLEAGVRRIPVASTVLSVNAAANGPLGVSSVSPAFAADPTIALPAGSNLPAASLPQGNGLGRSANASAVPLALVGALPITVPAGSNPPQGNGLDPQVASPAASPPVASGLPGAAPVSSSVLPSAVTQPPTPGSFVTIGSPLTANLGGNLSGSSAVPRFAAGPEPSAAEHHSRPLKTPGARPDAGEAPTIDWGSARVGALDRLGSSNASQDWLDDFLNHLGQNETQRNPNAGIRVHPTMASARAPM
jgi:hypothetical protein